VDALRSVTYCSPRAEVIFLLDRRHGKGTAVLGLINKLGAERLEKGDVPPSSDVEPDGATEQAGWRRLRRH
jgi:hypothetical protein